MCLSALCGLISTLLILFLLSALLRRSGLFGTVLLAGIVLFLILDAEPFAAGLILFKVGP